MAEKIEIIDSQKAIADLKLISDELAKLEKRILVFSKASREAGSSLSKIKAPKELKKSIEDLESAQKKTNKAIDNSTKSINKQTKAVNNQSKANKTLTSTFKNLLTSITAFIGIRMLIQFAKDTFELVKSLNSMAFAMKAVIKDTYELAQSQIWLREITNKFGAELVTTTSRYIKFRAAAIQAGLTAKETQDIFGTMTKAAGVLGLKTDELRGIYLALEQMISKGKITTEELRRQLGERLPGAMDIMAKSMGITTSELDKMMKKGLVITKDVLPKFAQQIEESFGIENVEKVNTLTASTIRLGNSWTELLIDLEGSKGGVSGFFKFFIETADEVIKRWGSLNTIMNSNIDMWIAFKAIAKTPFSADDLHSLAQKIRYDKEHNILLKEANRLFEERSNKLAPVLDLVGSEIDLNKLNNEQLTIWISSMKAKAKLDKEEEDGGTEKRKKAENIQAKIAEQHLFGTIKYLKEQIKLNNEIRTLTTNKDTIAKLDKENDAYQLMIDRLNNVVDLNQELADTRGASFNLAKDMSGLDIFLANVKNFEDEYEEQIDTAIDTTNRFFDNRIERLEQDREANEEYYDNLIDLAKGNQDEQDRLQREKEIKDKELRKKQNDTAKKQAIFNKSLAIAEIGINTAEAISKVIAKTPLPAGLPLVLINAALGAAQIASVIAQPVPKFKNGKDVGNFYEGLAIVNDGGKTEYREDKLGNISAFKGVNTLTHVAKDDIIHKDIDSLINSKGYNSDDIYKATVMASLASDKQISGYRVEKIFNDNLRDLDKKMTKGIRDGFRNVQFHSHNKVDINHALWAKSQEL